jgi:hypothetical protein
VEEVLPWEVGTNGRGKDVRKEYRRVNMAQILCTYMFANGKMLSV